MMLNKIAFGLIGLWVLAMIGSYMGLVSTVIELIGLGLGAVGVGLLWLTRSRRS